MSWVKREDRMPTRPGFYHLKIKDVKVRLSSGEIRTVENRIRLEYVDAPVGPAGWDNVIEWYDPNA